MARGAVLSNVIVFQILQRARPQRWPVIQAIEDALSSVAAAYQQVGNLVKQAVLIAEQPESFFKNVVKGGYVWGDRNRPQRRRQVAHQRVDRVLLITAITGVALIAVAIAFAVVHG